MFILLVYLALLQKQHVNGYSLFGVNLEQDGFIVLFGLFGVAIIFGWLAVFAGFKLLCASCDEPVLAKKGFWIKGLNCRLVWSAIRGRQLYANCLRENA